MRRAIAFITTRYGIAALLAIIVLAVVVVARLMGFGPSDHGGSGGPAGGATSAQQSGAPDDGLNGSPSPVNPVVKPGQPDPLTVANNFTTAWLAHTGVTADAWWKSVTKYTTTDEANKLKGADPQSIAPTKMTGSPQLGDHSATLASVMVPLDVGHLDLQLNGTGPTWQVSGVDWSRA